MLSLLLLWWSPFIPSRNLDVTFTYNHMALMSLLNLYHGNAYIVLTRADHYYTILYKITSRYYYKTYFIYPDRA